MYSTPISAKYFYISSLLLFILFANAFSNTRVAFSRPSTLIRNPSLLAQPLEQEYHLGFSSEIINLRTFNSSDAIFFKSISDSGFQYGIA